MDIVPVAVLVVLAALAIAGGVLALALGRRRGRRSRRSVRRVVVTVGSAGDRTPPRPAPTGPPPGARLSDLQGPSGPVAAAIPGAPSTGATPAVEAPPPGHPVPAPQALGDAGAAGLAGVDVAALAPVAIRRSVASGTDAVVEALVADGQLSTSGPITDDDVRTLVFVAVTSHELLGVLLEGRSRLSA